MKFTVRYEDMDKPIGTNDFIEKKIQKLEKFKYIDDTLKINIANLHGTEYQVNMTIDRVSSKEGIAAAANNADINTAIDECLDKLIAQIIKMKEKREH